MHFTRNADLIAVDMDGETVMVNVDTEKYFALDPVGSLVWDYLENTHSVQQIADKIRRDCEVGAEHDVENDMIALLGELQANGLVHPVAEPQ